MGKKRRTAIIIILALVIPASFFTLYHTHPEEPVYKGKTLTWWVEEYQKAQSRYSPGIPDGGRFSRDTEALWNIGTNAIPTYLKWVAADYSPLKARLVDALNQLPYVNIRTAGEKEGMAITGFMVLDGNPDFREPCKLALMQAMETGSTTNRLCALNCLANMGHISPYEVFSKALTNSDPIVPQYAAQLAIIAHRSEAEFYGVYKKFPNLKPSKTPSLGTNTPAANK